MYACYSVLVESELFFFDLTITQGLLKLQFTLQPQVISIHYYMMCTCSGLWPTYIYAHQYILGRVVSGELVLAVVFSQKLFLLEAVLNSSQLLIICSYRFLKAGYQTTTSQNLKLSKQAHSIQDNTRIYVRIYGSIVQAGRQVVQDRQEKDRPAYVYMYVHTCANSIGSHWISRAGLYLFACACFLPFSSEHMHIQILDMNLAKIITEYILKQKEYMGR